MKIGVLEEHLEKQKPQPQMGWGLIVNTSY
jgi:hypothetical protein